MFVIVCLLVYTFMLVSVLYGYDVFSVGSAKRLEQICLVGFALYHVNTCIMMLLLLLLIIIIIIIIIHYHHHHHHYYYYYYHYYYKGAPPKTECSYLHGGVIENGRRTQSPHPMQCTCTCTCTGVGAHTAG